MVLNSQQGRVGVFGGTPLSTFTQVERSSKPSTTPYPDSGMEFPLLAGHFGYAARVLVV